MKKYTRPQMVIEEFETNEYVAACWGVACAASAANTWETDHGIDTKNVNHSLTDHCSLSGNQVIYDDNNDGTADRMVEVGTDGLGRLACTIYTDSNYSTQKSIGSVKAGDYIYWTTSASDGRTWHHQGTVSAKVPNHPNRS